MDLSFSARRAKSGYPSLNHQHLINRDKWGVKIISPTAINHVRYQCEKGWK